MAAEIRGTVSNGRLVINERLSIPEEELDFSFARSGGPGGQNVNKVSTKVVLRFDLAGSPELTDGQKERIRAKLGNRIDGDGILMVTAQEHRSQPLNREAALARLAMLLDQALKVPRKRVKTRVPKGAVERRLEGKRSQSRKKVDRHWRGDE